MGGTHRWRGGRPHARDGQSQPADRRGRGQDQEPRCSVGSQGAAAAGVRRAGLSGGDAAQISLPRSPARNAARQYHEAAGHHLVAAAAHARRRFLRVPDADPHRVLARRRARLSRAEPRASRQVLRAAAGAAAIQAADHDRGLRPLFPDRALLPRRGRARRPLAGRILPARPGDELRHAGRCVQYGRADPARACSRSSAAASR